MDDDTKESARSILNKFRGKLISEEEAVIYLSTLFGKPLDREAFLELLRFLPE